MAAYPVGNVMREAEETLFHCLALRNELLAHVNVEERHFSSDVARKMWRFVREQIQAGGFTVAALADRFGDEKAIPRQTVAQLLVGPEHQPLTTPSTVQSCCASIRDAYRAREFDRLVREHRDEPQAVLSGLQRLLSESSGVGAVSLGSVVHELYDALAAQEGEDPSTVTTGLPSLDSKLDGGFRKGEYIIVAARPSMGKSTFVRQIAQASGERVLFVSAEDTAETFALRSLAGEAGVAMGDLRRASMGDDEWARVGHAVGRMQESKVDLVADADVSIHDIEMLALGQDYGLIVVDYLQMIVPRGSDRVQATGAASGALKRMAKRCGCPVVVASQLNRGLESRPSKRPILADLRDSGELEQDADVVLFLYRDEVYQPGSPDAGFVEVNVAKQRNGPAGAQVYVKVPHELHKGRIG